MSINAASAVKNALLQVREAQGAAGYKSKTSFYADVRTGLMVRPIKIGLRAAAIPAHEVEAVNAARIAGKTPDEIRALVQRLHQQRVQAVQQ